MCEIAVVPNPLPSGSDAESSIEQTDQACRALVGTARTLYNENPDGLGVVAVRKSGSTFEYSTFKRTDPEFSGDDTDLYEFFERNDDAWRFAMHARLKTHGGIGYAQTHPIMVGGCPEVDDIRYVMHNGVISNDDASRRKLRQQGHEFNTLVDSEVIPHAFGSLPDHEEINSDEFEEPDAIMGRANFILFGTDKILLRMENKYDTTTDFTILCSRRQEASVEPDHDFSLTHYGLITPDGESSFRKAPRPFASGNVSARGTARAGIAAWYNQRRKRKGQTGSTESSKNGGSDAARGRPLRGRHQRGRQTRLGTSEDDADGEDDAHDHREQTVAEQMHDDRSPQGASVVYDPADDDESSYYCNDHGWHDELVDGECPACVHERVNAGRNVNENSPWTFRGVKHCPEHDEFYNSGSECPGCAERAEATQGYGFYD